MEALSHVAWGLVGPFAGLHFLRAYLVGLLRLGTGLPAGYTRKINHVLSGVLNLALGCLLLRSPALVPTAVVLSALGIGLYAAVAFAPRGVLRVLFAGDARPTDNPPGPYIFWPALFAIAGGLGAVLLVPDRSAVMVGVVSLVLGDAAAEPVGITWGRHRYRVRALFGGWSWKSWEGSAAVAVATAAGALPVLRLAGHGWPAAAAVAAAAGVWAAVVEALTPHGLDNLVLPPAVAAAAAALLGGLP